MSIEDLLKSLGSACITFVLLGLAFIPLEKAYPASAGQPILRAGFITDVCFFIGRYLLWLTTLTYILDCLSFGLNQFMPNVFRSQVAAQSWWLQAIEVVLLSDLLSYWGHRLQHQIPWLWRFHAVHHSSEHLDWMAAQREHPIDSLMQQLLSNMPALILGFPTGTLALLIAFRGIWAVFVHSNVRLPLGPLKLLIGSPELHHWHHERIRSAGNYCNMLPLMDLLFGTYVCPDHEPAELGIREQYPKDYIGQLFYPFWPSLYRRWFMKGG